MRTGAVALALVLVVASTPRPARAQFSLDARRIGMGGVSLSRDGNLRRYNPAYRVVKDRADAGGSPKFSIPVPIGLIDFLREHPLGDIDNDPLFNPDSAAFNPIEALNLVLNPPIFYEIRKAPTPTNDVEFTIGQNAFVIDLHEAQVLIPEDEFGIGSMSRLLDLGGGGKGFHFGVMGFLHYEVGFVLDDALRGVLKAADSVQANDTLLVLGEGVVQSGFAPTLSYAGRVWSAGQDSEDGVYVGAAVRYYFGAAYGSGRGPAGFSTGDPVFGTTPAVVLDDTVFTSNKPFGRGVGGDVGVVWINGPFEVGVGVNDIGAELTWTDTKQQRVYFDAAGDSIATTILANHIETKTELPISYIANAAILMGTGTTLGADIVNSGRGTVIHVGGEQRLGMLALRGGVSRDQRKKMQFGWGGGVRLGPLGLDVGFWTHSNSFADQRGITMATSISLY
ncbi:MAG: hypothetical protein ACREMC_10090 [Gemmatimonadales bacterium]